MSNLLESPYISSNGSGDNLYRARGDEVYLGRPILTGDIFTWKHKVGQDETNCKTRTVIILQHPCSMRTDGVNLSSHLLVAEVRKRKPLSEDDWNKGYFNLMPLPALKPAIETGQRDQAADFNNLHIVDPEEFDTRLAALSQFGVNLLLQRWIHYTSRLIVPTYQIQEVTEAFYEEADLFEDWCFDTTDTCDQESIQQASKQCLEWLRADRGGRTYQECLKDPQSRSTVRAEMRKELKSRQTS
ncbi:hypothetical protein [Bifidobacterium aquikefiri]|mgnify:CR=1 FL=1|uniref:hypothetical protein n=1 Tax=Bifidobacterium aquikefiri TaxID=1653207 RepID=UPI0023F1B7F4|nr:hypothetical protein [Bifidobacterium aquikefiri]